MRMKVAEWGAGADGQAELLLVGRKRFLFSFGAKVGSS
jgi:hypothetical protein